MDTKKVFLDTNIIIDLLCHREHCAEAATVVNMGIEGKASYGKSQIFYVKRYKFDYYLVIS